MLYPTLDEARALATQGNLCPLYCEVPADLETPVSAYLKVARGRYSFLLESVEGGERLARYSFIGTEPYRTLRTGRARRRLRRPPDRGRGGAVALQGRAGAGAAALHRRRRRLPGLRVRALLRAAGAGWRRRTRWAFPSRSSCSRTRCWSSTTCSTRSRSSATSASMATSRLRTARPPGESRSWSDAWRSRWTACRTAAWRRARPRAHASART